MEASSNGGDDEVSIFTHTNIATHIVVVVSPHITTFDFQREVERIHFSCFPKLGEVEVCKVMVKRKACFYCLPKSLIIKYAFQGLRKPWFLHVKMSPLSCLEKHIVRDCDVHVSDYRNMMNDMVLSCNKKCLNAVLVEPQVVLNASPFSKKIRKKKKCLDGCLGVGTDGDSNEKCLDACDKISGLISTTERDEKNLGSLFLSRLEICASVATSSAAIESQLETHLEAKSDGNFSKRKISAPPYFAVGMHSGNSHSLQPKHSRHKISRNELGMKTKVGKRILSAAYKLKASRNKQRPSMYLFRSSLNASPGIGGAIFEISDSDY